MIVNGSNWPDGMWTRDHVCLTESDHGRVRTVIASDDESYKWMKGELILSLPDKSGYINALISILRDKYGTVGLLAELYVKRIWRGQGYGKVLMSNFESQTLDVTKVDILVALTAEPQLKGFNLQRYYESRGFQAVYLNGDSVLMANKGQAETIINNLC